MALRDKRLSSAARPRKTATGSRRFVTWATGACGGWIACAHMRLACSWADGRPGGAQHKPSSPSAVPTRDAAAAGGSWVKRHMHLRPREDRAASWRRRRSRRTQQAWVPASRMPSAKPPQQTAFFSTCNSIFSSAAAVAMAGVTHGHALVRTVPAMSCMQAHLPAKGRGCERAQSAGRSAKPPMSLLQATSRPVQRRPQLALHSGESSQHLSPCLFPQCLSVCVCAKQTRGMARPLSLPKLPGESKKHRWRTKVSHARVGSDSSCECGSQA